MGIVGGFDVHCRQMIYDWVDTDTGEVARGRSEAVPPGRGHHRDRTALDPGQLVGQQGLWRVPWAVRSCRGWQASCQARPRRRCGAAGLGCAAHSDAGEVSFVGRVELLSPPSDLPRDPALLGMPPPGGPVAPRRPVVRQQVGGAVLGRVVGQLHVACHGLPSAWLPGHAAPRSGRVSPGHRS